MRVLGDYDAGAGRVPQAAAHSRAHISRVALRRASIPSQIYPTAPRRPSRPSRTARPSPDPASGTSAHGDSSRKCVRLCAEGCETLYGTPTGPPTPTHAQSGARMRIRVVTDAPVMQSTKSRGVLSAPAGCHTLRRPAHHTVRHPLSAPGGREIDVTESAVSTRET